MFKVPVVSLFSVFLHTNLRLSKKAEWDIPPFRMLNDSCYSAGWKLSCEISLLQFIGTQVLAFIFGLAGSAVLLDNSTQDSKIAPLIRESMRRLIMNSHHDLSKQTLAMVQENVSTCYMFYIFTLKVYLFETKNILCLIHLM